jgi:Ras-related protein Rab-28
MDEKFVSLSIVGDGSTGKSSIIASFCEEGFKPVYKQTVGIDFYEKKILIRGIHLSLRVWDVGGQSINSQNLQKYIAHSTILFLNYDVTNHHSFDNLDDWLNKIRSFCGENKRIYLIGNKTDLYNQRQVLEHDHHNFIMNNNLSGGLFVSAKTGENILKSFYQAAFESQGIILTSAELSSYDKILKAHVVIDKLEKEEERTTFADEIERLDREAELRKKKQNKFLCIVS